MEIPKKVHPVAKRIAARSDSRKFLKFEKCKTGEIAVLLLCFHVAEGKVMDIAFVCEKIWPADGDDVNGIEVIVVTITWNALPYDCLPGIKERTLDKILHLLDLYLDDESPVLGIFAMQVEDARS